MLERVTRGLSSSLLMIPLAAAINARCQPTQDAPDAILVHGKVLTVDAHDSIAEAIAIRDGRILRVGTSADILAMATEKTRVIDLHGKAATPGMIDAHGHFADGGVNVLYHLDLSKAASIAEVRTLVQQKVATLKPGEWLLGDGWDESKLAELRYLYAADLDSLTPHNPAWLMHTTGHYGVANSAALRLAKIDRTTPNPPAGTIDRDANGAPTGVLKEAAMAAVASLVPPPTPEQEVNGLLAVQDELHREGMTAVKDADIHQQTWDAYKQLLDTGKLTQHVCVLWHAGTTMASARATLQVLESLPKAPQSLGDGRLLSCGAKLYMDGSGGARTAWLYADWNKNSHDVDTGNRGYPATDPAVYRSEVLLFHNAGYHVGTHAIGDRAIDWVVDTYAQALAAKPTPGLRHSIIHANIPTDHAIQAMAAMQARYDAGYPESQAPFLWWIGDTYAGNFGTQRSLRLNPFATYLRSHVIWAGGSDYFVTPLPARYGIWASVVREPLKGVYGMHPFGTAEAVDVHTALRSYTAWAARQLFLEDRIGSLEVGKDADIAVWDADPYSVAPEALKDLKCDLTLFHGAIVYRAKTAQLTCHLGSTTAPCWTD
jgi:predicted amidohydrolase YtcJ